MPSNIFSVPLMKNKKTCCFVCLIAVFVCLIGLATFLGCAQQKQSKPEEELSEEEKERIFSDIQQDKNTEESNESQSTLLPED